MKIAAFIDGPNLYAAAKSIDLDIDYMKMLAWLKDRGQLVQAAYYTAMLDTDEHNPMQKLVDWLSYNGYLLVTKPAKEFTDIKGARKVKGNMDVELTVDMLGLADHVDQVVLFSGDGDYCPLVEAMQRKGVPVTVVSSILGNPSVAADELRRQANEFIELDTMRVIFSRTKPTDKSQIETVIRSPRLAA